MNIVFMGTPAFAAVILERLCRWREGTVAAVYCQPDRPAGRGHKLTPPSVKVLAQSLSLPVLQPPNFKNVQDIAQLAAFAPHVLIVAAYGLLLPQSVLDIPTRAPINVHASLLPRYRGAAPIQRALMDGATEIGVSIMRMEATLDTGPVYATRSLPLENRGKSGDHTSGTLHNALAQLGADTLIDVLTALVLGDMSPIPQDTALATYAPKLTKAEGLIDWARPAQVVHNHIRAVTPWPGARCSVLVEHGKSVSLTLAPGAVGPPLCPNALPSLASLPSQAGQWHRLPTGEIAVSTLDSSYILTTVRPQNRSDMPARDFVNGYFAPGHVISPLLFS